LFWKSAAPEMNGSNPKLPHPLCRICIGPLPALCFASNLTNATGCVRYCNAVMSMICGR
jgi:hypothetical protein